MFLTHPQAKIDQFEVFDRVPIAWSYVEHNIHRPWFYIAVVQPAEEFNTHSMLMVSNERLLASILSAGSQIESVLLVTPDHVNHQGRWVMEYLEFVERHTSPAGWAYVYGVEGGKTYVYGDVILGGDRETIYSASGSRSSSV